MIRSDSDSPALEVRDLSIRFGEICVLDSLNFQVEAGSVHALVGESGSGKTLACLALAHLHPQNASVAGRVCFAGEEIDPADRQALQSLRANTIRYVFQDPYGTFNPSIRIGTQISESFPTHTHPRDRPAQIQKILKSVGLDEVDRVTRAYPFQLSGGMLQRAGIAMALAGNPRVLVCDEPTTALDPLLRAGIVELLRSLADERKIAIVFVTHDLRLLNGFARTVTVLQRGITMDQGELPAVLTGNHSDYTRELLGAIPNLPGDEHSN